jgi:predicted esterase
MRLLLLLVACTQPESAAPSLTDLSSPSPSVDQSSSPPADLSSAPDLNGDPGPGPTQTCTVTADANGFFTLNSPKSDYVARLPPGYDPQKPLPLLVAIHGCGDTAKNFATWGAVPFASRATQDYLAISIGGRDNDCWMVPADGPTVIAAIDHMKSCFWVHQKKVVLAGYSSGGMLAYNLGMTQTTSFAGILIENSGLSQGVGGAGKVDTVLNAAAWKINVAHSARIQDGSFAIDGVRADRDKLLAHGFPLQYRELDGTHDGTSDDWSQYLLPKMVGWEAP